MLRFDVWPPQFDKVHWTKYASAKLHEAPIRVRDRDRDAEGEQQLALIGAYAGSLLAENVLAASGRQTDFWVQRIAVELTQGWHPAAMLTFMRSVVIGADISSEYDEYRTPIEPVSASTEEG